MTQAEQYEADVKANPTRLIRFAEWLEAKCDRLEAANAEMLEAIKEIAEEYLSDNFAVRIGKLESIIQRNTPKEG